MMEMQYPVCLPSHCRVNKLASLEDTLVRNFDSLTGVKCMAESLGRSDSCGVLGLYFRSVVASATVRTKSIKGKQV